MNSSHNNNNAMIGKYVLDSLSIGMYNHPLMVIREYIQNSTDAIDDLVAQGVSIDNHQQEPSIEINIDGRSRSVEIKDNGIGIPLDKVFATLHEIGQSEKHPSRDRGFRGIGRLGGLGYCRELVFRTKCRGENKQSISVWNGNKLKELIEDEGYYDIQSVVSAITTFTQDIYNGDIQDHFFIVEMLDVRSAGDALLDVPLIKDYVSQVAPVPFRAEQFRFAEEIDQFLRRNVPMYETYMVRVNGNNIYKPYQDNVRLTRDKFHQEICDIKYLDLANDSDILAYGWLAELDLAGIVSPGSLVDGLRVRCKNVLIGDKGLISRFFREGRFSNYLIGEIHVVGEKLTPNSRRDDFEDNDSRNELHDAFIKTIGIPYSREIRELSAQRSAEKKHGDINSIIKKANSMASKGYLASLQKQEMLDRLHSISSNGNAISDAVKKEISALVKKVIKAKHILKKSSSNNGHNYETLNEVFELIYGELVDKSEAEGLITKILSEIT
jgi:hypothetical protein